MKKVYPLVIGLSVAFLVGCAEKPMAKSVIGLAGNMKVVGWKDYNNTCKPKVVVKKVVEYKYITDKDSDGDGVVDSMDKCPNTPKGLVVNHDGCPIITTLRINFDFNKWRVKKIYYPQIKDVALAIKSNPNIKKVEVAGYTDNIGSKKYNQYLSIKRAKSVAKILEKFGVEPNRIVVRGYGEAYPLVPNTTDTNRALNRRVEIVDITNSK